MPEITATLHTKERADPDSMVFPMYVARLTFRGAARGCASDLIGSRADLACAMKYRAMSNATTGGFRFDDNDAGSALVLDWAIGAYGPVTMACADG